ncbi:hypothetical protein [Natrarchaeobius halalkaliphilus]|uniref:hypothetical protein n=1 Tax=Natrarchaeobius halalkaliphilus TaxID=1679091 RepID=UPI000F537422|nr:hypothetical protein [Natrarchaeobius halalkaliphilus]
MSHIEFLGISGAGKSTLMKELLSYDNYMGGKELYDIRYWGLDNREVLENILRILNTSPKPIRMKFGRFIYEYVLRPQLFINFFSRNTEFINELVPYFERSYEKRTEEKLRGFANGISKYELGKRVNHPADYICLDECFYHRTRAVRHAKDLPNDSYFDVMPTPSILIWVEPPPKLIYKRRKERDGKEFSMNAIKRSKKINAVLAEKAIDRGSKVIQVKNVKSPKAEANYIHSEIENHPSSI